MSKSPETMVHISPSPSPSPSFDSGSEAEDPAAGPKPFLGIRELRQLSIQQRSPRHGGSREILVLGHPDEPGSPSPGVKELPTPLPFARDVNIKGWKVVGGKTWTDKAKMGSYVVYDIEITLHSVSCHIWRMLID